MSFSVFDLFLAVIFSQGLFLSIAIQLLPNRNTEANKSLSLILIIASILVLGRLLLLKHNTYFLWIIASFLDVTIFLFGPILYTYIRRLIFKESKVFKIHKAHYILPVLHVLYFIWSQRLSKTEYLNLLTAGDFYIQFITIEALGIASVFFYLFISCRLILRFDFLERNQLSYNQKITTYIKSLLTVIFIFLILWCISFFNYFVFDYYHSYFNYQSMWASMSLLMYSIGFFSLTQPGVFRMPIQEISDSLKENKNRLAKNEIELLKNRIDKEMIINKIYQKHDLNLAYLSELINTTPNNLSWLLNNIYDKSFYEYVNEFRINDFIRKIKDNQHKNHTLIAIAEDVGFNSKSTFNKTFKSVTNKTPSSYIKALNSQTHSH